MKRLAFLLSGLFFLALQLGSLFLNAASVNAAFVPCDANNGDYIFVSVTGSSDPSSLTASGTQVTIDSQGTEDKTPLTFGAYSTSPGCGLGSGFLSTTRLTSGGGSPCTTSNDYVTVDIKDAAGDTVGTSESINACQAQQLGNYVITDPDPITVSSTGSATGEVTGVIDFIPPQTGTTSPNPAGNVAYFGGNASGTLTGPSCTNGCTFSFTGNGNFTVDNLTAGNYTLVANYTPPLLCLPTTNPAHSSFECSTVNENYNSADYDFNIAVVAGQTTNVGTLTAGLEANNPTPGSSGGGTTGTTTTGDACDNTGFSMSWLVCSLFVDPLEWAVGKAVGAINELLTINVNTEFNDSCLAGGATASTISSYNGGTPTTSQAGSSCITTDTNYTIWGDIRDIALSLLVLISLIMVISSAIEIGPFDAYTVKKVLPRILVAVIAITFSWEIGRFLVKLSDDLGSGVYQLIYSVIGGPTKALAGISNGILAWLGIGAGVAVAGTVLALGTVGPLALLMLLLPTIIALGIGFFVILIRRIVIVVCVIFSPIAFLAYILPGTEGLWKFWKKTFSGALFLFPMVTAVIAVGGVMAYVTDSGNSGTIFAPLLALIFFIAPFFLLPKLVKISGGMMGTIGAAANNASKNFGGRAKKARQGVWANRKERSKAGSLYSNRNPFSRYLGKVGVGVGVGARGHYGVGKRGEIARAETMQVQAANLDRDAKFQSATQDDITRMALEQGSKQAAQEKLKKIQADDERDTGVKWDQAKKDAAQQSILKADTIGYNSHTMLGALRVEASNRARNFKDVKEANETIDKIAATTGTNVDRLRGEFAFRARKEGGRADLGALNGRTDQAGIDEQVISGNKALSAYQRAQGDPTSFKNYAMAVYRRANAPTATIDDKRNFARLGLEMPIYLQNGTGGVTDVATKLTTSDPDPADPTKQRNPDYIMDKFRDIMNDASLPDRDGNTGQSYPKKTVIVTTAPGRQETQQVDDTSKQPISNFALGEIKNLQSGGRQMRPEDFLGP